MPNEEVALTQLLSADFLINDILFENLTDAHSSRTSRTRIISKVTRIDQSSMFSVVIYLLEPQLVLV